MADRPRRSGEDPRGGRAAVRRSRSGLARSPRQERPRALSHLRPATELAAKTVDTVLGVKPRTDFAWPVDGAIDSSIVDVATSAGAHNVISRSDSLRDPSIPYTPTAARPIGGGNTAVVADARLSRAFEGDMANAGDATHAVQEFLAQTQLIGRQSPGRQRSIVVAPQRMPSASQAQAMASALRTLESERWTQPLDLSRAAKAKPDPSANRQVPSGAATRPLSASRSCRPRPSGRSRTPSPRWTSSR